MADFLPLSNFNEYQRDFLLKSFGLKKPLMEIKSEFQGLYECKVRAEDIQRFEKDNAELIKERTKQELRATNEIDIAHSRVRLEKIREYIKYAETPQVIRFVDQYDIDGKKLAPKAIEDINHVALEKYLRFAQSEEYIGKKLYLEWLKTESPDPTSTEPGITAKVIQINDGIGDLVDI